MSSICLKCKGELKSKKNNSICSKCRNVEIYLKYKEDEAFIKSRLKNISYKDLVIDFVEYMQKTDFSPVFIYRNIVDFVKVLNQIETLENLNDMKIEFIYYEISVIKSERALLNINAFLFDNNLLYFKEKKLMNYPENIYPSSRYVKGISIYLLDKLKCSDCGRKLTENSNNSYCNKCMDYRSFSNLILEEFIDFSFKSVVIKNLYKQFVLFIHSFGKEISTQKRHLRESIKYFQYLEPLLPNNYEISELKKDNLQVINNEKIFEFELTDKWYKSFKQKFNDNNYTYFIAYLENINLIKLLNESAKDRIMSKIDRVKEGFRKALILYINQEYIKSDNLKAKNATKELKDTTIVNNFITIFSFLKYLEDNHSHISSWSEVTDKEINMYLLTLKLKSRFVKKRLMYNFFGELLKKKMIFINPIDDFIARDFKIEKKPLTLEAHAKIYGNILKYSNEKYIESFTTSLVYFHALTTNQILSIELQNIDLDKRIIMLKGRPPVYLSDLEMYLIHYFLEYRKEKLSNRVHKNLYCSYQSFTERAISNNVIKKYVKEISGYTPKDLRTAGLQFCVQYFGTEYLHQCIGLSLTQSSRYGEISDFLIDDVLREIKDI